MKQALVTAMSFEQRVVNALDWRDLGRYLLVLAALPLLLGFRKTVSA